MFFIPTQINLCDLKINNTDQSSNISMGSTVKINMNVFAKKSQGIGQQQSDFTVQIAPVSKTIDTELSDCYSIKINN